MAGTETDLVKLLPYTLQEKTHYFYDFVKDRLFEVAVIEKLVGVARRFEKDIELIFLLRLLYGYFVLGYQNYDASLRFFESLNIDGFQIGTTHYSRDNTITREWFSLAEELEILMRENQIERYMRPTISTDEIIRELLTHLSETGEDHDQEENS